MPPLIFRSKMMGKAAVSATSPGEDSLRFRRKYLDTGPVDPGKDGPVTNASNHIGSNGGPSPRQPDFARLRHRLEPLAMGDQFIAVILAPFHGPA
jgi:hypothetical protein